MMQMSLRPLWVSRGVPEAEVDAVFAGRVAPPDGLTKLEAAGKVTVKATGDKALAGPYGDALGKRTDELRKCVALGDAKADKKGSVTFDVVLGKSGQVVMSTGVETKSPPSIADCFRYFAQTTAGKGEGKVKVDVSFTR